MPELAYNKVDLLEVALDEYGRDAVIDYMALTGMPSNPIWAWWAAIKRFDDDEQHKHPESFPLRRCDGVSFHQEYEKRCKEAHVVITRPADGKVIRNMPESQIWPAHHA